MEMKKSKKIILTVLGIIVAVYTLFPFYLVVMNTFKNANGIVANPVGLEGVSFSQLMSNLSAVVNNSNFNFWYAFGTSVIITVISLAVLALFGGMAAWVICRNKTKWSTVIYMIFIASMIIPFLAIMIPLVSIYGGTLNVLNHRITLIFMHTGFSMAMSVFMFHGFIKGNIPIALEEASCIDGCSHLQTFFLIVFPLLKPTISTMVILNSLAFWNDFLLPSLVLTDKKLLTLPLSTYSFYGTYSADYGTIMAGLLLCVMPILILYIVLQKQIIGGVVAGAVK